MMTNIETRFYSKEICGLIEFTGLTLTEFANRYNISRGKLLLYIAANYDDNSTVEFIDNLKCAVALNEGYIGILSTNNGVIELTNGLSLYECEWNGEVYRKAYVGYKPVQIPVDFEEGVPCNWTTIGFDEVRY